MSEQQYIETVKAIIKGIGGKDNLQSATYCGMRLRLVLKDESNINPNIIDKIDFVKGHFLTDNKLQLIIGTGTVDKVYAELISFANDKENIESEANESDVVLEHGNLLLRPLKTISDVFEPIIPAIVACGLLKAFSNLITAKGLFYENISLIELFPQVTDIASIFSSFASAPFVFLPVLIAFSATRVFGGSAFLGATLGAFMIHPELMSFYSYAYGTADVTYWNIFGLAIEKVGFQGTVLPTLVMSWVLATLEKAFRKVVPASLDSLVTPLFALFLTALITFAVTGPILREAGTLLANYLQLLYETRGLEGAGLVGFLYAPIVITGMHQLFPILELKLIADIAKTGGSFILPVAAMSSMAQGGATWAAFFVTNNKKLKGFALGGGTSAILGVTEPAMFGVNLKLRYPFYAAICAAAAGAAYMSFTGTLAVSLGVIVGIPSIVSIDAVSWLPYIYGMCIAFFGAFFATLLLSITPLNSERRNLKKKKAREELAMPSVSTKPSTPVSTGSVAKTKAVTEAEAKTESQSKIKDATAESAKEVESSIAVQKIKSHILHIQKTENPIGILKERSIKTVETVKTATENTENTKMPVVELVTGGKEVKKTTKAVIDGDWIMPIEGKVIALENIPDPAFSSGVMGAGFAIKPIVGKEIGKVFSPVAGTVSAIFPSKHAVCIDTIDGIEMLIHIGVDTVSLDGEGFTLLIEEGAKVQAGTPLLEVDWECVEAKVPSIITPILFTSIDGGQKIEIKDGKPFFIG